jgi:hypothetical protein
MHVQIAVVLPALVHVIGELDGKLVFASLERRCKRVIFRLPVGGLRLFPARFPAYRHLELGAYLQGLISRGFDDYLVVAVLGADKGGRIKGRESI